MEATPANVHDVTQTSSLLTGEEDVVYGDSGYLGAGNREDCLLYTSLLAELPQDLTAAFSWLPRLNELG